MVAKVNVLVDQYEGARETLELLLKHVGPQAADEAAEKLQRSEAEAEARRAEAEAAAAAEQEAKLAAERQEQEAAAATAKAESEAKCVENCLRCNLVTKICTLCIESGQRHNMEVFPDFEAQTKRAALLLFKLDLMIATCCMSQLVRNGAAASLHACAHSPC